MAFPGDLWQTLVDASSDLSVPPTYTNALTECVYISREISPRSVGETVNFVIPSVVEADTTDIGNGAISLSNPTDSKVSISLNHKASTSKRFQSFDQVRTPEDLLKIYLKPMLESNLRFVNGTLAALITSGNLSTYSTVTGGDDVFSRAHLATAWGNIASGGAPVDDIDNLVFVTDANVYANMTADTTLTNESIVGLSAAESAQQRAIFLRQLGARIKYDQKLTTVTTGVHRGVFMHRSAIALRTAVEPNLSEVSPGAIKEIIVYPKPELATKIQMFADPTNQGVVLHMATVFGCAVVRPEFASYMQTT